MNKTTSLFDYWLVNEITLQISVCNVVILVMAYGF